MVVLKTMPTKNGKDFTGIASSIAKNHLRAAPPKYRLNREIAKNGISSNSPRMKFLGH